MAETSIEWCDFTFNPWTGCQKVAPECDHCYAEGWAKRSGHVGWGPTADRRRTTAATWSKPRKWDAVAGAKGIRRRVFVASLADVFDNAVPDDWRADLWALIRECPNLDWLLLTKRPQNIAKMLPDDWGDGWPNVWLGTSAGTQETADRNIPALLAVPAAVRFVSAEPLLEFVDLETAWFGESALDAECWGDCAWCGNGHPPLHNCQRGRQPEAVFDKGQSGLDWIIAGGESGPGARPMDPEWARSLRDQCAAAGTAFFMKQIGGTRKPFVSIPDDLMVREWPR
ncbi:phage Gp37/Gp68 family protein [Palleronia sp.]|uniref:phage Gp37/Gp68 family protein n=1 Tax=Palleronia sp. TaxID=1940284 RepID=UPI0035C7CD1D